jgi:hypothetical protein
VPYLPWDELSVVTYQQSLYVITNMPANTGEQTSSRRSVSKALEVYIAPKTHVLIYVLATSPSRLDCEQPATNAMSQRFVVEPLHTL